MADRRFTETELATILRLAAESQAKSSASNEESTSYSMEEIQRIAGEVGIDPKHVLAASHALSRTPEPKKRFRLFGAPVSYSVDFEVEGHLDEGNWEEVVHRLRSKLNVAGTASVVGTMREWNGGSDWRLTHMSARRRGPNTQVTFQVTQRDTLVVAWMAGLLVGIPATLGFCTILMNIQRPYGVFGSVLPFLIYFAVHRLVSRWHESNRAEYARLQEDFESAIAGAKADTTLVSTSHPQDFVHSAT